MIFSIPIIEARQIDIKKIGTVVQELNTLALHSKSISIEPSVILDTGCFEEYQKTRILSDKMVQSCIEQLKKHKFEQVDMYLSVYKDCMMDSRPLVVSVSYSTIYNAIVLLYERWFDLKPAAKRTALRIDTSDTFPAILIQSHRDAELSTITCHPKTGKILQNGEGASIVHCSKAILDVNEEEMIKTVDTIITSPRKIFYIQDYDGNCIIRRTEPYPMTTEARVNHVLDKYMKGALSKLDAVSLILPEDISTIDGNSCILSAKIQHSGISTSVEKPVIGKAVFQWTNISRITEESVFLADDINPNDVASLKLCAGGIFSRGGYSSHASTVCRSLYIPCINSASDLFFDPIYLKAYTSYGEKIHEGDRICILNSQWSVGGTIIRNNTFKATRSESEMEILCELINSFSDSQILGKLPLDLQFHISKLINVLKKIGWLQ